MFFNTFLNIGPFSTVLSGINFSDKDFLTLEKKIIKDLLYKKMKYSLRLDIENLQFIYVDKESKIFGYRKNFDCTQKRFFLPFSENKKFLKSTIFGTVTFREA